MNYAISDEPTRMIETELRGWWWNCGRCALRNGASLYVPGSSRIRVNYPSAEASAVWGLGAPRNTPADIVDKLNKEINAALADPKLKGRLTDMGISVRFSKPTR
jgi:Tripartite tricarboxylate transporter family receptor